jgi:hypothetical protein
MLCETLLHLFQVEPFDIKSQCENLSSNPLPEALASSSGDTPTQRPCQTVAWLWQPRQAAKSSGIVEKRTDGELRTGDAWKRSYPAGQKSATLIKAQPNTTFRGPLALLVKWDTWT